MIRTSNTDISSIAFDCISLQSFAGYCINKTILTEDAQQHERQDDKKKLNELLTLLSLSFKK